MLYSTWMLLIIIMITTILMTIASTIMFKTKKDREKSSPFECGFTPYNTARIPFSLRFFLIAMIFLIFDVEITLLLPTPLIIKTSQMMPLMITMIMFLVILTIGLYYEWKKGALDWANFTYI